MALTRGVKSDYPCPICLVPKGQLDDLCVRAPLRTAIESSRLYQEAMNASTQEAQNAILKDQSLRPVYVCGQYDLLMNMKFSFMT